MSVQAGVIVAVICTLVLAVIGIALIAAIGYLSFVLRKYLKPLNEATESIKGLAKSADEIKGFEGGLPKVAKAIIVSVEGLKLSVDKLSKYFIAPGTTAARTGNFQESDEYASETKTAEEEAAEASLARAQGNFVGEV